MALKHYHILAISGSLNPASTNTIILKTLSTLAPANVTITLNDDIGQLPFFSPDKDPQIEALLHFKQQVQAAGSVIFSTPEYAFGVPGVLKNALDWLVYTGELNQKPVAVISASPLYLGGDKALASLLLTLTALGTIKDEASSLSIGNIKNKISPAGEITDGDTLQLLSALLNNLIAKMDT